MNKALTLLSERQCTYIKSQVFLYVPRKPMLGVIDRRIPGAHWPVSLIGKTRFMTHPVSKY